MGRSSSIDSQKWIGVQKSSSPITEPQRPWQEKGGMKFSGEWGERLGDDLVGPLWLPLEGPGRLSPSVICVISAWHLPGSEGQ